MPTLPCPAALPTCPAAHLARWYTAFISFYCRTPARRYTAFIPLYPIGVAGEMNAVYDALPFVSDRRLRSVALPNALNFGFDYSLFLKVGAPAVASTILCSSRWVGLLLLGKACEPLRSLDEGAQAGGGGGVSPGVQAAAGLSRLLCPSLHLSCTTPASCCIELPYPLCTWLPALAVHGKPGRAMIFSLQVDPCRHSCGAHRSRAAPPCYAAGADGVLPVPLVPPLLFPAASAPQEAGRRCRGCWQEAGVRQCHQQLSERGAGGQLLPLASVRALCARAFCKVFKNCFTIFQAASQCTHIIPLARALFS